MSPLKILQPERVFYFFEKLSSIPRGSGNMTDVAQFCEDFAVSHDLKYIRDGADNVVIYKNGTVGYEKSEPIILQGHLDMVCQKTPDCNIDFAKDGLRLYIDGDFIKARGTTLGADNGIAVAIVLAILEDTTLAHPPIEAVFTVDEEVGMIGARALDMSILKAKRMINLDSEEDGTVTVSCAGGSDFVANIPLVKRKVYGTRISIDITGLKGGHSGVDINKNRVNANIIAGRILNQLEKDFDFNVISINGGDKANAIPNRCVTELCVANANIFCDAAKKYVSIIKEEIADREPDFDVIISAKDKSECDALDLSTKEKLIQILLCAPNGITEMSACVNGLVETSLNLGILTTNEDCVYMQFALRSNKQSALVFLEEKLAAFFKIFELPYKTFGHYPPWEFNKNSLLRDTYCSVYTEMFGEAPKVETIHAGLECGVFADAIQNFDCIAIGPALYDVHTTREKLSISSTQNLYDTIIKILEKLK